VRIAADSGRNALIIYATPQHYRALENLLRQLDIMPAQVLIEATVAEVTLIGDLKYGLEWYLKNNDDSRNEVIKTMGGLGLGTAGISYSLVNASQRFQVLVNALAEEELVKVLSSPRIMVRDGKGASITVGTQVPVVTSDTARVDAGGDERTGVVRAYQYRNTGVTLQVTPTVHAEGIVTLEISQDVSEPAASGGENPLILNRTLNTEVVAASGQTVLLGGLIKENQGRRESKVPWLGDLPGLGHLFKVTTRGSERTELVVMITPHIIRSTRQLDEIGRAIFREFRQLESAGP